MALIVADRVKETTVTAGTGSVTLKGAYGGFQTFSDAIGDGNSTYYTIENFTRWEVGIGTYTSATNTLSRDTVLASSNSNNKIGLDGVSTVFVTYPANKALLLDDNGNITGFTPSYSGISFPDGSIQAGAWTSGNLTEPTNSGSPLTLVRRTAGNLLQAYVDNTNDRTIALHLTNASSPTWKLGLASSPSTPTTAPDQGYIYGNNGSVGAYAASDTHIVLNYSNGAWITHKGSTLFNLDRTNGALFDNAVASTVGVVVKGASAQSADLQQWQNSSSTVLAKIDNDGDLTAKSFTATDGSAGGVLFYGTDGVLTSSSDLFYNSSNGRLGIGTDSPDYALHVAGNISLNEYIRHNGDTNTYIRFRGDQIDLVAGGVTMLTLDETSQDRVIVNNGKNNVDFRVEGDGDENLIYTDAANDMVGIGTDSPSYKLDVAGHDAWVRGSGFIAGSSGIVLTDNAPNVTTNTLYNTGGSLYFNGSPAVLSLSNTIDESQDKALTPYAVSGLIGAAPDALNTLQELASALDNDASYATTISNSLATKATTTYVDAQVAAASGGSLSNLVASGVVLNASIDSVSGYAQASGGSMGQSLTSEITIVSGLAVSASGGTSYDASNRLNAAFIGGGNVSSTEFDYLNGVTSAIQTQINNVSGYAQGSGAVMGQALTTSIANVSGYAQFSGGAMGQAVLSLASGYAQGSGGAMGQALTTSISNVSGYAQFSGGKMGQSVLSLASGYAQGSGGAMGQALTTSISNTSGYAQFSGGAMGLALDQYFKTEITTVSGLAVSASGSSGGGGDGETNQFSFKTIQVSGSPSGLQGVLAKAKVDTLAITALSGIQTLVTSGEQAAGLGGTYTINLSAPDITTVSGAVVSSGGAMGQALTTSIASHSGIFGSLGHATTVSSSGAAMGQALLASGGAMGQALTTSISNVSGYAQFSGGKMGQAVLTSVSGYAEASGGAMGQALTTSIATKQATLDASNRLNAAYIGGGNVSTTEFDYLNGVTSSIQTQFTNVSGYAQGSGAAMGQSLSAVDVANSGFQQASMIASGTVILAAAAAGGETNQFAFRTIQVSGSPSGLQGLMAKSKVDTLAIAGLSGIQTLVTSGEQAAGMGGTYTINLSASPDIVNASGYAQGSGGAMGQALTTSISNVSGYAQFSGGKMGQAVLSLASGYAQGSGGAMGQALTTSIATKQATLSASNRLNSAYIAGGNVSNTEFDYLNGVTSAIQTQLNNVSGYAQGSGAVMGQALTTSIANVSGYAQFSGGAMGQAVLTAVSGYAQGSGGAMGQALTTSIATHSGIFGSLGHVTVSTSGAKMGQAIESSGATMGQALTTSIANVSGYAQFSGGAMGQAVLIAVSGYAQGSGGAMGQALTTSIASHSGIFGSLGHVTVSTSGAKMGQALLASGGAMGQSIDSYLKSEIIIVSGLAVSASGGGGGSVDIDGLSALGGVGLHQTQDHFMFSDNGTEKKITFSNLQDAIFADISGDGTVAAGGALTIADDVIDSAELADACSAVTSFTAPLVEGTTSIQTPLIEYTDGDDAITINDGGSVLFAKSINQGIANAAAEPENDVVNIDLRNGNYFHVTLGEEIDQLVFTHGTDGQRFLIRFTQPGGANYDVSCWGGGSEVTHDQDGGGSAANVTIKWAGGIVPSMTRTNGKADTYGFIINDENAFDGFIVGQNL